MSNKAIVLTTSDSISFAHLVALKGAASLAFKGMKRHGRSAVAIAKEKYGLKGNKQSVFDQLQKMVNERLSSQ